MHKKSTYNIFWGSIGLLLGGTLVTYGVIISNLLDIFIVVPYFLGGLFMLFIGVSLIATSPAYTHADNINPLFLLIIQNKHLLVSYLIIFIPLIAISLYLLILLIIAGAWESPMLYFSIFSVYLFGRVFIGELLLYKKLTSNEISKK